MTDFTGLIEKLEGAEAGSRELDVDVVCALFPDFEPAPHSKNDGAVFGPIGGEADELVGICEAMEVTTSLDATLALVEEKLPRASWDLDRTEMDDGSIIYGARIFTHEWRNVAANAKTPALALLIALCRALQSTARFDGDDEEGVRG